MDARSHSLSSVLQDYALRIPVDWLVRILLLISMTLQLALVVLGSRRYRTLSGFFRFVVWGSYISADAVAISALGTMMHSARNGIYGIWAPVLLLHLGGPDAITAYSMAYNELWLRHGFNMVYQVSVAVYVLYSSPLGSHALASAILVLVAGVIKYGERTLALWFGSYSQIVKSCLPISEYLNLKHINVVEQCGYVVIGEEQLQRVFSPEGRKERDREGSLEASPLEGRGMVTIEDVKRAGIERRKYSLCLSHALFKMYKRRFVSLYFDEGDWPETRGFWAELGGKEAFRIVEMELKFIYDGFFSKWSGTAFSKWGVLVRLLNTTLMGAAGFLILRETGYREAQRTVTYVVISVALVVEVFQLCRIMISDWTRVRLICARVEEIKHPQAPRADCSKWCRNCRLKVIKIAVPVLELVQNVIGGDRYWSNGIHQHCLIEACLNRSRFVWKMAGFFSKVDSFIVRGYIKLRHIHKVSVQDDLKGFIFRILIRKCSPTDDSETCRDRIYNFEKDLSEISDVPPLNGNLEVVILMLHIATTICDMKRVLGGQNENEKVRFSRLLSRYCAYLLLSRPNLLPLHPDMARIAYTQLVERLVKIHASLMRVFGKHSQSIDPINMEVESAIGPATEIARRLLEEEEKERWDFLAEYWGGLVIYMAVYNKATFHAECVAGGGEFLSQVWVLLGHMGCGEQSDSAVRKKIERSMLGERTGITR